MNDNPSQDNGLLPTLRGHVRSVWDWLCFRLLSQESVRFDLLIAVFNILLMAVVFFALLNTRTEIRHVTIVQTGSAATMSLSPLPTDTPTPGVVFTLMPFTYPAPELIGTDIIGCNVVFRWDWSRELAEDEYFEVRVGIGTPERSAAWVKEPRYELTLVEAGKYVGEVAICRGNPRTRQCEQLAVSEWHAFSFGGCPTPVPSLAPTAP